MYSFCIRLISLPILLLTVLLTGCATTSPTIQDPPHQNDFAHNGIVLLISIDGMRADRVGTGAMPTLDRLASSGVRAQWMNPSYPTQTFPNHYTLITGLRPDHHGIVDNTMDDPELGHFATGPKEQGVSDPRWWGGEPIWRTLQKHGGRVSAMFWPSTDVAVAGELPDDWAKYDGNFSNAARVTRVLEWLDRDPAGLPNLITLYFDAVDIAGHDHGPDSPEYADALTSIDTLLAQLVDGIEARGLREKVNLIIVSDHGMAAVPAGRRLLLEDELAKSGLSINDIARSHMGQFVYLTPMPGREDSVAAAMVGTHSHYACWRKADLPPRWHYGSHPRIPPVVCQVDVGWQLQTHAADDWPDLDRGAHGYAPESAEMRAVFVANGPAFAAGKTLPPFDNVDVYSLLALLLKVPPLPNDGQRATWDGVVDKQVRTAQ